jgi:hypothetical protein
MNTQLTVSSSMPDHTKPDHSPPYQAVYSLAINTRRSTIANALSTVTSSLPYHTKPNPTMPHHIEPDHARCLSTRRRTISNPLSAIKPMPRRALPNPASPRRTVAHQTKTNLNKK